ncbi:hypothetical protein [Aeribacillus pallidus]|uniref:hypothetical protein n=1 Tax=Aeribacillus pallidus TaxID=33936 RepID=UPI003D21F467
MEFKPLNDSHMYFHSPIRVWKQGNRINVKIELIGVLLSVSPHKHPKQFERLERLLGGELPPFITYKED